MMINENMTLFSHSKAETIINESDIDDVVIQSIYTNYNYTKHKKMFRKKFRLDY